MFLKPTTRVYHWPSCTHHCWHQCVHDSAWEAQRNTGISRLVASHLRKATSSWAEQSTTRTLLPRPLNKRPQRTRCPHVKGTNVDLRCLSYSSCFPSTLHNCRCSAGPLAWAYVTLGAQGARTQPCPTANLVTPTIPT